MLREDGVTDRLKSGGEAVTLRVTIVLCMTVPSVPVMVSV